METEKQELGYLVDEAVRFIRDKKGIPIYLKSVDGLDKSEKPNGSLHDDMYIVGMGNPDHMIAKGSIEIGTRHLGNNVEKEYLHLKTGKREFMLGHSDYSVFFKEGDGIVWGIAELKGGPSLKQLVQDVIQEAAGIPTIVARGYKREQSDAAKSQGGLIALPGYQLLKSQ